MKAQEYRGGNLIKSGKGIYKIYALSIPQILAIQLATEPMDSQEKVFSTDGTIIEPIQLTEEWLLKFGFEITYSSNFRLKFDHVNHSCIGYDFSHNTDKSMEGFRFYGKYIHIEYVHQLQNLYFALTGQELEFANVD